MAAQPLTHHEILGLVEPFSRQGLHLDLPASQRMERRLSFKAVEHKGLAPDGGDVRETLQLTNTSAGRYRLTRTLMLPGGAQAPLHADGSEPAALLAAIRTVPLHRQFFQVAGCLVVLEQGLPSRSGANTGKNTSSNAVILSKASTEVAGLQLSLRVPAVTGVPAEIKLQASPDDDIELPEDLLAVLGWPWSRLQHRQQHWTAALRLRGKDEGATFTRSAQAQACLRTTIEHLARTLAEPPQRFHERHLRRRWGVTLRRGFPLIGFIAILFGAAAVPKIDLAEDSVFRMLIFHAPPLLLAVFFCLQEMPRIEIPPRPRASTAAAWRTSPIDKKVSDEG